MQKMCRLLAASVLMAMLLACGEKQSEPNILDDISGVWRARSEPALVSIIYTDRRLRLLIGDTAIPVALGDIDRTNATVNLNVTLADGRPAVWTIRQVWDKEHKSFHLLFTMHDGSQDELSFVRKVSSDDLNKIASAEARLNPGSISSAASTSHAPVQSPNGGPANNQGQAPGPHASIEASSPQAAESGLQHETWSPSFDCGRISSGAERLICSHRELAQADVQLAQKYREVLNRAADKDSARREQVRWLKTVRDACADMDCMLQAYSVRISELSH